MPLTKILLTFLNHSIVKQSSFCNLPQRNFCPKNILHHVFKYLQMYVQICTKICTKYDTISN